MDKEVGDAFAAWCDANFMVQTSVVNAMFLWVMRAPEPIRRAALGLNIDGMEEAVAAELEAWAERVRSKKQPAAPPKAVLNDLTAKPKR